MTKAVAILGTGMTAFVAAQAIEHYFHGDVEFVIYGPNMKPVQSGAKWYEREIPEVNVLSRMVSTESVGTAGEYIKKIGGPITRYTSARNNFLAFNYHDAHQLLWEKFNKDIVEIAPDLNLIENGEWGQYDFVFNTAPRINFFSPDQHHFFSATRHWRLDEVYGGHGLPYAASADRNKNIMIFDGTPDSSWFRITQTFGLVSIEWPFEKKPPIQDLFVEILPLAVPKELGLVHVESAWRDGTTLAHVGAVARWEPSTDVGEVYEQVLEVLTASEKKAEDDYDSRGYL